MSSAISNVENATITQGLGDLPKVVLKSDRGSEAELYLFGGCLTSWKVADKELLFVRPDAVFNGQKPISGGVPHCFPQFGPGVLQQHGFARNMNWSIASYESIDGNPSVTLELKDDEYSRSMWDYGFHVLYKVVLDGNTLSTELKVTNVDEKPFSFTSALHTFRESLLSSSHEFLAIFGQGTSIKHGFHVLSNHGILHHTILVHLQASVIEASVSGLEGCKTLNKDPDPKNPIERKEERYRVTFPGFVDCIYLDAPNELHLENGLGDTILIKNTNWSDAVLWNPYMTMESCYKDFVCVENAKIGQVELEPNDSWTAKQHLSLA